MTTQLVPTDRGPYTYFHNETIEWPDSGGININLTIDSAADNNALTVDGDSINLTTYDGSLYGIKPNSTIEVDVAAGGSLDLGRIIACGESEEIPSVGDEFSDSGAIIQLYISTNPDDVIAAGTIYSITEGVFISLSNDAYFVSYNSETYIISNVEQITLSDPNEIFKLHSSLTGDNIGLVVVSGK